MAGHSKWRDIQKAAREKVKQRIMVSPLAMNERGGWYNPDLVIFLLNQARWAKEFDLIINPAHQVIPAAGARNLLAKRMLEMKCDWLLMVDNDVAPPDNLLELVKNATDEMDIILPVCHMWCGKDAVPMTVLRPVGLNTNEYSELRRNLDEMPEWLELEAAGTGCILIRRRVFEGMEYPYFKYKWSEDGCLDSTEDIIFSQEARAKGFRIWGNTKMVAGHFHTVNLSQLHLPTEEKKDA